MPISSGSKKEQESLDGAYECFHCGCRSVILDCDFSAEDYGYEFEGIVQDLHCNNCGARIQYIIDLEESE